jgi:transcriptional regulator with XRE-family HTH domain
MTGHNDITLAERIKALRTERHLGIRELGRAVGVSGMHISNLEKGKSAPSAELVSKLAEALDADLDELLHLADQIDPEVVDVIQASPYAIPAFLRSAKNLTPEQWEALQAQVEQMTGGDDS